ncbi:MAG: CPBP family intramembrane glutamic endopeptidase [Rubrobacter sp.]
MGGAGLGFLVGFGAIFVGGVLSAITALVLSRFGYSTERTIQQPFMDSLQTWVAQNPALAIPAIIFVVVVIGPACEELAFRGGIFNGLRNLGLFLSDRLSLQRNEKISGHRKAALIGVSTVLAAVLSSVFFAVLHLEPVILPSLFVFALVLCYLFQKTGSLLPCFVAHATFNSFATAVIILSGLGALPPLPS